MIRKNKAVLELIKDRAKSSHLLQEDRVRNASDLIQFVQEQNTPRFTVAIHLVLNSFYSPFTSLILKK